jgi:hypothetical protein
MTRSLTNKLPRSRVNIKTNRYAKTNVEKYQSALRRLREKYLDHTDRLPHLWLVDICLLRLSID